MEGLVKGDVVVIPFPFSDLSNTKKRPALVLSNLQGDDLILCQITSKNRGDSYSVFLNDVDFSFGTLPMESNIRPNKLFTADDKIVIYKVGTVNQEKIDEVIGKIIGIIQG